MTDIVDLHNHLLPAVDDGAQSFDESLRHLRLLFHDGVRKLAVSPHLFGWLTQEEGALDARLDRLEDVFVELRDLTRQRPDVPELYFSQEILCQTPEMARAVFAGGRAGVRDTDYALVEFGFDLKMDCTPIVRAVIDAGKRVVISHPERYRRSSSPVSLDEMESWKRAGAALQINGGSLLGDYGEAVRANAWRLVQAGLADIISTDHHADHRPVSPAAVMAALRKRDGEQQAILLMCENTARILENRELSAVPRLEAALDLLLDPSV